MGQYFIIANDTKREFLHPHTLGGGLKFMELVSSPTVWYGFALLLHSSDGHGGGDWCCMAPELRDEHPVVGSWAGDAVYIVGDYDSSNRYDTARNDYRDVSFDVLGAMCRDTYWREQVRKSCSWRWDPEYGSCSEDERKKYEQVLALPTQYEIRRDRVGL